MRLWMEMEILEIGWRFNFTGGYRNFSLVWGNFLGRRSTEETQESLPAGL